MKRIGFSASEEMSFENVDGRTDDGRTTDTFIYYKLTYEPSAKASYKRHGNAAKLHRLPKSVWHSKYIVVVFYFTGDKRQTKQFCFLDADCLVAGESQSSSRHSAGKYPV